MGLSMIILALTHYRQEVLSSSSQRLIFMIYIVNKKKNFAEEQNNPQNMHHFSSCNNLYCHYSGVFTDLDTQLKRQWL